MSRIMCTDIFETHCNKIITNINSHEIVKANKFISLASKIAKKHPFVLLSDFLEDFIDGVYTAKMIEKYHLYDYNDFTTLTSVVLGFKGNRSKNLGINNKNINLQNPEWGKHYELLITQSRIFHTPLVNLLNCNIFRALVVYTILKYEYIERSNLKNTILASYDEFSKNIKLLSNKINRDSFENYIKDDLDKKLDDIIMQLTSDSHITTMDSDVSMPAKYSHIDVYMYDILDSSTNGISYKSFGRQILNEFPLLKLIPEIGIFENVLEDMEKKERIIRKRGYWKYSYLSDQLFTHEAYDAIVENMKNEMVHTGRTKFFGRNIQPDQFISELKNLKTGDLDDLDDQVTRIAGLVLSDAALLQSPRENISEFDFIVDLTNYNFRPEQEVMMKKIDLKVISNIVHCKVLINDPVTINILSKLKKSIPDGEQAVIFTCMPVNLDVLEHTRIDRTIQIIDADGIRSWCSITPTIPCRRCSIAKVMYGDGMGKIVLVKSLNYESGLAIVNTTEHTESTFHIGCLREIDLHVTNIDDFEIASEKYFNFICFLASLSPNSFENGITTNAVATHTTYTDLLKNTQPKLFEEGFQPEIPYEKINEKNIRYVEFNNTYVTINLNKSELIDSFSCSCNHLLNEEHYYTLCSHLVSGIDHICRNESDWFMINNNLDLLTNKLVKFQKDNIARTIDAISAALEPKSKYLFKEYLLKHVDTD